MSAPRPGSAADPAADWIRSRADLVPEVGLLLGSGLDRLADRAEVALEVGYGELPGFPRATTPGHPGRLVLGRLEGRVVCVFRGRLHRYEGHPFRDVAAPVRLLHALGASVLVVTNAAGVVNPRLVAGRPMLIVDHVNLLWGSPLAGRGPEEVHDAFPDMSQAYDRGLRALLRGVARAEGIALEEGVYAGVLGPSYETPAEIAFLRRIGADAVGMSTVPEVIAARERGLRVAGLSLLTNPAAGLATAALDHADVLAAAERARPRMETLVRGLLRGLATDG